MQKCGACPHPQAAHGPEDGGCRFGGCYCAGFVDETRLAGSNIPVLTIPPRFMVDIPDMLFNGEPFPYATVAPWTLVFEDDGIALLTLSIPVSIGPNVQHEPATEPEAEPVSA